MKSPLGSKKHFEEALAHFKVKDKKLAVLVEEIGYKKLHFEVDYFESLVSAIISQQVSVAAAASIQKKLTQGIGGQLIPSAFVGLTKEDLRVFGVSGQKAGYLLDLVEHFVGNPEKYEHLDEKSDEEIEKMLVEVKGIGPWTAQMFLMFTMGRPDVFAPDDLGLKYAMAQLYGWKSIPEKKKLLAVAQKWSPYKTLASRYLWMSRKNNP